MVRPIWVKLSESIAIIMVKSGASTSLGTLEPGAIGILDTFNAHAHQDGTNIIGRLREMGFAEGLEIELLHQSLFGKDPIAVRVGRMTVALRRAEANVIRLVLS